MARYGEYVVVARNEVHGSLGSPWTVIHGAVSKGTVGVILVEVRATSSSSRLQTSKVSFAGVVILEASGGRIDKLVKGP